MTRLTQISKEELEPVITAREKAVEAAQNADKVLKDARLAELEFKVQIQQLYLNKGLDANCRVDISNGAISWPDEIEAQVAETMVESPTEIVVTEVPVATEDQDRPRVSKKRGKKSAEPEGK